jgi:tetratricopeptide (TPR) repeat protein
MKWSEMRSKWGQNVDAEVENLIGGPAVLAFSEDDLLQAVCFLRKEKRFDNAIALVQRLMADRSDISEGTMAKLMHLQAECYYDSGDHGRAIEVYDRILLNGEDIHAFANRGLAYWAMRDTERAIESYKRAAALDSVDPIVLRNLGELYNTREEYNVALEYLQRAALIKPDDAATWCALGVSYHNLEDWDNAYTALERAIELDPTNKVAQLGKSKIERHFLSSSS